LHLTVKRSPAGIKFAYGTEIPKSPIYNWKPAVYHFSSIFTSNKPLDKASFTIALIVLKLITYCNPPNYSSSNSVGSLVQFSVEFSKPKIKNASKPFVYPFVSPKSLANIWNVILIFLYL
jgi:hypothetical protein